MYTRPQSTFLTGLCRTELFASVRPGGPRSEIVLQRGLAYVKEASHDYYIMPDSDRVASEKVKRSCRRCRLPEQGMR